MRPSKPGRPIFHRHTHLVLLLVVVLLAAWPRFWQARESLWLDELHTAWVATGDIADVAARSRMGNQSPLYFYLEWGLAELFGRSELCLRFPSLVAGVALVPLLYLLVWNWTTSRAAAFFVAVLAAVDRDLIYYSQEARPYALVQLVAVGQVLAFWKLTAADTGAARRGGQFRASRQWLLRFAFSLGTALLFGLHYTAALLLVAEVAYFAYQTGRGKCSVNYYWFDFAFDLVLALVVCLPAYPHLIEIFRRRQLWSLFVDAYPTWSMRRAAGVYLGVPLLCLGLCGLLRRALARKPTLSRIDGRAAALAICWLVVPTAFAWLATYINLAPLFFPRYLLASWPALPASAGLALATLPTRTSQCMFACLLVGASVGTSGMVEQFLSDRRLHADRNEDWRGAVAHIAASRESPPLPVLLSAGLIEDELLRAAHSIRLLDYCRFPLSGLYRLDHDDRQIVTWPLGATDEDIEALLAAGEWWLVVRGDSERAESLEVELRRALSPTNAEFHVGSWQSFGDLHVVHMQVKFEE